MTLLGIGTVALLAALNALEVKAMQGFQVTFITEEGRHHGREGQLLLGEDAGNVRRRGATGK